MSIINTLKVILVGMYGFVEDVSSLPFYGKLQ